MSTEVYGASDDLIKFEGDVSGEVGSFGTDDADHGVLVMFSDGTMLEVKYGKGGLGIWGITLVHQGSLFERIDVCTDEDAGRYSDTAHFRDGMARAWAAKKWELVG